ncbi:tetratricopeptide repeat protein [Salinarimonas ramus]|uniref:Tetratricopeptide repeat protein 38 n=1 Tax=Salinarimonas ramus TaxID=690164 RepID=A0A917Q8X5_9HYPH|nr:tetratricopeptide repeat protein [Salinarimonas ramus]GGK37033.1 tetratricopeptide repeat protein 38 family protein [Salinarimonas ramus]
MIEDRYGFRHTSETDGAVAAFAQTTFAVAAHRPGAAPALAEALAHDPDLVAARALEGFACLILARAELLAPARAALAATGAALVAKAGGTPEEQALADALALALEGRFRPAAARLEAALDARPGMLLPFKIAQSLRFMAGDLPGMLAGTEAALPGFSDERPGHGFAHGARAFALEEAGRLDEAEAQGRRAVAAEPADAWGFHAVAHVMETQGRVCDGIGWIEAARPAWCACNNFAFHMAWHLALFHMERAEYETVLALYDTEIAPCPSEDVRDAANAVSLLWRLRQEGVDVGARWDALAEIARRRRRDATLTFAALHGILALAAANDRAGLDEALAALEARAAQACEQAEVLRAVGLDLARALTRPEPLSATRLAGLLARLPMIGGSHAQRDVFVRTLALQAADETARARVLAVRGRVKRPDRFAARLSPSETAADILRPSRLARAAGRP